MMTLYDEIQRRMGKGRPIPVTDVEWGRGYVYQGEFISTPYEHIKVLFRDGRFFIYTDEGKVHADCKPSLALGHYTSKRACKKAIKRQARNRRVNDEL